MAQTGYTPILLYSSTTAAQAPAAGNLTNSTFGSELAINITDGKLFYKDNTNAVQVIAWKTTPTTAGGTGLTSYTAGDLPYYATGTTLSKLAIGSSGQILTSTGTAPQWTTLSGVAVTTFSAGTTGFTPSVATSGAVTLAGTLITSNGGTGLSSYSQGDLLYYNTGTTLTALAKNTSATRYLSNTGANNNPAWAQVDLTNGVTGTLPVANGGTGTSTAFTAGSIVFAGASGVYSQNNANFFWDDANGRLGLGTATPGNSLQIIKTGAGSSIVNEGDGASNIIVTRYSTDVSGPQFQLRKYRGTRASQSAIASGDQLGFISFSGYGGTSLISGGGISMNVETYTANNDWSSYLELNTKPTGAGGTLTARVRVHASGGVSIGNSTDPGATNLSVTGTVSTAANLTFTGTGARITGDFSNATAANRVAFQSSTTNGATVVNIAPNGTSTNASIIAFSDSAIANSSFLQMRCDSTAEARFVSGAIGSGTPLPMTFYVNGSERMRIATDGKITFADVYATTVGATNRDLFIDNTGLIGYVSSLRESKTEIKNINDISWFYQLNPVSFKYRKKDKNGRYTDEADGDIQYGMIAEEVEQVHPDLCFYNETKNGKKLSGIQYSKLVPVLLKAIQQQHAIIDELTNRVKKLEQ